MNLNMVDNRSCLCLVAFFLLFSLITFARVEATIHFHKWEVKYAYKSPDCFKKLALTINGHSPGPIIHAQQGDTVVVNLTNTLLTENVAVHWHGIRQVVSFLPFNHSHYFLRSPSFKALLWHCFLIRIVFYFLANKNIKY